MNDLCVLFVIVFDDICFTLYLCFCSLLSRSVCFVFAFCLFALFVCLFLLFSLFVIVVYFVFCSSRSVIFLFVFVVCCCCCYSYVCFVLCCLCVCVMFLVYLVVSFVLFVFSLLLSRAAPNALRRPYSRLQWSRTNLGARF